MRSSYAPNPVSPRRGRVSVAGALLAAGLAIGGCGSSDSSSVSSSKSPIVLDTEKVERAIERSSLSQRGAHAVVSCPAGVHQKKGRAFSCTAVLKGESTRFAVTQVDGSGRVHYVGR